MPIPPKVKRKALKVLEEAYDKLSQQHVHSAPKGATIPVGGSDWMDSFFRLEGVRATLNSLGRNQGLAVSFAEGKVVSEIAIKIWNKHREWQVHRWEKAVHSYLDGLHRRIKQI